MKRLTVKVIFSGDNDTVLEAFTLGDRTFRVREVIDGWYGADHTYLKLTATDNCLYILRHDLSTDEWEIVLMESSPEGSDCGS